MINISVAQPAGLVRKARNAARRRMGWQWRTGDEFGRTSARPDVLDPGRLVERRGQVVVGQHQDRMFGLAPGQDHDVGSRLVTLVAMALMLVR